MSASTPDPRRWQALALVCVAFFMTVLDVSIVNVALPSIKTALNVAEKDLQWVITAYTITFGGFLLLGGRAGDLLGRRRMFMIGIGLFAVASLACGLSNSIGVLIASRAVQGLGAAIISPATLSIITTTFEEGSERNKALGIWGAMGGSGAAAGVLFGGILTKYAGWEWIFFVNVPVGAAVLLLTRPLVRESRIPGLHGFDFPGAATITASLALLVYGISKAPDVGWASGRTIGILIAAAVLLVAFIVIERRQEAPMVPFRIFRLRTVTGANVAGFLLGAVVFSNFFLLTLYVQQVLHYSALKTGLTFLFTAGTVIPVAGASQALVTKIGVRPVLVTGPRADDRRHALVHADPRARKLRGGPVAGVPDGRRRHGVLVHPDVDRRARRGREPRGRARVGADQHVAADRRRARRRDRGDRRVHAREDAARERPRSR